MFLMKTPRVDYNQLAPTYHSRYDGPEKLGGIARALKAFPAEKILEVGCGTGRFVEELRQSGATVFGVDASTGMLGQAAARLGSSGLVAARANALPFASDGFDLIYVVNAIHHFDDARSFIVDAARLLRPGGALAIIGMDPRTIRRRYYYQYFDGSLELDMVRYASFGQLVDWAWEARLERVELAIVEQPSATFNGLDIFKDPFLEKASNSLLALLSEDVYAEGLRRIRTAAEQGAEFCSEIPFGMVKGYRSPNASAIERK